MKSGKGEGREEGEKEIKSGRERGERKERKR